MKAEIECQPGFILVHATDDSGKRYASFKFPYSGSDIIASAKAGLLATALEDAQPVPATRAKK